MAERKPIVILRLNILSNGKDCTFELDRNPRMTDADMLTILESALNTIKSKYGKTN
ncbi:MAG: hypothetical protein J6T10_00895 [Methanobrevibacter sp.]|nr:hypothetical protein [Methanobrevibacter sp.]